MDQSGLCKPAGAQFMYALLIASEKEPGKARTCVMGGACTSALKYQGKSVCALALASRTMEPGVQDMKPDRGLCP